MTNQEAIEIVEDIVEDIGFCVPLIQNQEEAIKIVIHDAKNLNEMINNIPHWTIDKSYNCEEVGEALHKVAESIGGHGGFLVSAEDIHKALERERENE